MECFQTFYRCILQELPFSCGRVLLVVCVDFHDSSQSSRVGMRISGDYVDKLHIAMDFTSLWTLS